MILRMTPILFMIVPMKMTNQLGKYPFVQNVEIEIYEETLNWKGLWSCLIR